MDNFNGHLAMQACFARTRWAVFTPLPAVGFKLYKLQSPGEVLLKGGEPVKANGHHESDDKRKKTPKLSANAKGDTNHP